MMPEPWRFVINGRYLSAPETAVNMVAGSLTKALLRAVADRSDIELVVAIPPDLQEAAESAGLPFEVMGSLRGLLWEQFDLPRFLRGRQLLGFFNSVPLRGRGHVTLLHDVHVFEVPPFLPRSVIIWRRMISRAAGWRGRRILTVSEYSKRRLIDLGIGAEAQISVVYNGVDHIDDVPSDPGISERIGLNGPYFTGLATTEPHKNSGVLLEAIADPALSQAKLVLIGGHASAADFEAAGYAVPENAVFPGFVTPEELRFLYQTSTAVCLPSLFEGFGLPALEAMHLGTPAIVTNRTAPPELCEDGAYYASPDDPASWASAMSQVLRGEGDITSEARRSIAAQYTWDAAAQRVLKSLSCGQ